MTPTAIAEITHETIRAYDKSRGTEIEPHWDDLPEGKQSGKIRGVGYVLSHPNTSPAENHMAWCEFWLEQGWSVGAAKDVVGKRHHHLVPFHMLPHEQKVKDHMFVNTVLLLSGMDKIIGQQTSEAEKLEPVPVKG